MKIEQERNKGEKGQVRGDRRRTVYELEACFTGYVVHQKKSRSCVDVLWS